FRARNSPNNPQKTATSPPKWTCRSVGIRRPFPADRAANGVSTPPARGPKNRTTSRKRRDQGGVAYGERASRTQDRLPRDRHGRAGRADETARGRAERG